MRMNSLSDKQTKPTTRWAGKGRIGELRFSRFFVRSLCKFSMVEGIHHPHKFIHNHNVYAILLNLAETKPSRSGGGWVKIISSASVAVHTRKSNNPFNFHPTRLTLLPDILNGTHFSLVIPMQNCYNLDNSHPNYTEAHRQGTPIAGWECNVIDLPT